MSDVWEPSRSCRRASAGSRSARRPARCRRCCRPACRASGDAAHGPGAGARRSTPTRSSPSSATTPATIARAARAKAPSETRPIDDRSTRPASHRRRSPPSPPTLRFDEHSRRRCCAAPRTCCSTGSARRSPARARGRSRRSPRFARADGAGRGPERSADLRAAARAALRRDGERRGLALRRAGRRAQRLGVPSGGGGVPAGAGGRAGARRESARELLAAVGRRLRGRHPRRRVPRPLALPDLPHHRHRRHARRRGRGRPSARARRRRRCCTPSARPARRRPGLWEFLRDAADSKQLHTAHAAGERPDVGLPRARTASPARGASSKARRAWRRACRATPIRRAWSTGLGSAGRWPRPRSSSTPRAGTRIRPPMRCCR